MSTTIGRDHVVNLVTGNPHPFAVHFDLVVVAHHAALGRATIHQVAARALAVISFERRVSLDAIYRGLPRNILLAPMRLHNETRRAHHRAA